MRIARLADHRRLCEDVCVFCLTRGARPRPPAAPTPTIRRNFRASLPSRQAAAAQPALDQPRPKKFGGFANKAQSEDFVIDDWGDTKERAAVSSVMASRTISAPRFDGPTPDNRRVRSQSKGVPLTAGNGHGNGNGNGKGNGNGQPRRPVFAQEGRRQETADGARQTQQRNTLNYSQSHQSNQLQRDPHKRPGPTVVAAPEPPRRRYIQREQRSPDAHSSPSSNLSPSERRFVPQPRREHQRTDVPPRKAQNVVQERSSDVISQRHGDREAWSRRTLKFADEEPPARPNAKPDAKPARGAERGKMDKGERRAQKFAEFEDENENALDDEEMEARREKRRKRKAAQQAAREAAAAPKNAIELPSFISVQSLATALRVRPEEFTRKLEELGFENVSMDHIMNAENAGLVAMEYGLEPVVDRSDEEDIKPRPAVEDESSLPLRPPIVTIMGHVDHGKTTLLDYLRQSSVAASEHGGITQHIGAFSVRIASAAGRLVTFLDTPGHAAFLSMRQRGATVTDIVVLVVAADDSVKPQTIEAIKHAKAAGVQIIVAITKCDKDSANPQRVKTDLVQHDIEVEDLGGAVQAVEVSGKTGAGVPELEDAIIAQADVLDVRADPAGSPEGWVLEASTRRSGRTATVLVRRGTLEPGAVLVAGTTWTRVRTLTNEAGVRVDSAGPGTPVEVDGWRDQPAAGDEVLGAPSEARATDVVTFRRTRAARVQATVDAEAINAVRRQDAERRALEREAADEAAARVRASVADSETPLAGRQVHEAARAAREEAARAFRRPDGSETPGVYVVVKADVAGSVEAVVEGLRGLPLEKHGFALSVLRAGVGGVSESDVAFAAAAPPGYGFVVNFAQELAPGMTALAERAGVRVLDQSIIYRVIDEMHAAVEERLPPVVTTRVVGEAEAVQLFDVKSGPKRGSRFAGCRVVNGVMTRSEKVRVFRGGVGGEVVYDGRLAGLKNVKRDVMEMRKGSECGMTFEGWDKFAEGDVIQCYNEVKEPRRLV